MLFPLVRTSALSLALSGVVFAATPATPAGAPADPAGPVPAGVGGVSGVAVINLTYIIEESPQFQHWRDQVSKEYEPRRRELQQMQQEFEQLTRQLSADKPPQGEALVKARRRLQELRSETELKGQALSEDVQRRSLEERAQLLPRIQALVEEIAKERQLKLVITGQSGGPIAFADPSLDLSAEIIARLKQEYAGRQKGKKR